MILTYQDLDKVRREKYDPSDISSRDNYLRNYPPSMITTTIGIVENNSDPDGLGRLRVRLPLVSNALTPWIFQVQPFASKGYGTWFNP
ncbi:phage baseplate assembly protein V, partial [Spirochaeta cellobiosiphila]